MFVTGCLGGELGLFFYKIGKIEPTPGLFPKPTKMSLKTVCGEMCQNPLAPGKIPLESQGVGIAISA